MTDRFSFSWLPSLTLPRLAIFFGFALTLLSALGQEFYVAPAARRTGDIDADIDAARTKARLMRSALAVDELMLQSGGLVFAVRADFTHNPVGAEMIAELERRALDGRHEGVKAFLAELAALGEVDYAALDARYETLVETERRDFTIETYRAANAFEADLASQATTDEGVAAMRAVTLRPGRRVAQDEAQRRELSLLALGLAGSSFVFLAAMAQTREGGA